MMRSPSAPRHRLCATLFAAVLLAGCASARAPRVAGELDADRTIALRTGQSFVITLPADRPAGLGWFLAEQSLEILSLDGEPDYRRESGGGARDDAPGSETWRFTARRAGRDELNFEYRHLDAPDEAARRKLHFEVTAQ